MVRPAVTRSIPNILTGSRLVLAGALLLLALHEAWVWSFWILLIALVTDFLDGLAAKMLQAYTRLGEQLDPIADFCLAASSIAGIIAGGYLDLRIGLLMLVPALYVGYVKFFSQDQKIRLLQPMFSVPYLLATWVGAAWVYASLAYGWSWWYVVVSVVILIAAAQAKRHRLRVWFRWLLARFPRR